MESIAVEDLQRYNDTGFCRKEVTDGIRTKDICEPTAAVKIS